MKDDYNTNPHYFTYTILFKRLGECTVLLELGSETVGSFPQVGVLTEFLHVSLSTLARALPWPPLPGWTTTSAGSTRPARTRAAECSTNASPRAKQSTSLTMGTRPRLPTWLVPTTPSQSRLRSSATRRLTTRCACLASTPARRECGRLVKSSTSFCLSSWGTTRKPSAPKGNEAKLIIFSSMPVFSNAISRFCS